MSLHWVCLCWLCVRSTAESNGRAGGERHELHSEEKLQHVSSKCSSLPSCKLFHSVITVHFGVSCVCSLVINVPVLYIMQFVKFVNEGRSDCEVMHFCHFLLWRFTVDCGREMGGSGRESTFKTVTESKTKAMLLLCDWRWDQGPLLGTLLWDIQDNIIVLIMIRLIGFFEHSCRLWLV